MLLVQYKFQNLDFFFWGGGEEGGRGIRRILYLQRRVHISIPSSSNLLQQISLAETPIYNRVQL